MHDKEQLHKASMTLTDENLKDIAAMHYTSIGCTGEDEFEKDLDISKKVMQQLNKLERGDPKANPRLLVNYVVTLFNVFDYEFARALLFYVVDEKNHARLKSLLLATNRANFGLRPDLEPCLNTLSMLKAELQ